MYVVTWRASAHARERYDLILDTRADVDVLVCSHLGQQWPKLVILEDGAATVSILNVCKADPTAWHQVLRICNAWPSEDLRPLNAP